MEENIRSTNIPIAIDSNIFIALSKLANDWFDPNNEIKLKLRNGTLSPFDYKNIKSNELPPILQDEYLGKILKTRDGAGNERVLYSNLMNIWSIYRMMLDGRIKVYLVPSVYGEIKASFPRSCIKDFCTIISVPSDQFDEFKTMRDALADEYVLRRAMKGKWIAYENKFMPENDAVIMAEASIIGLILVTANAVDFVNKDKLAFGKHARSNIIKEINAEFGYLFLDNAGREVASSPYTPAEYVMTMKRYLKGIKVKKKNSIYLESYFTFDENNNY